MSTYTRSRGKSVGAGNDGTAEFDAITIPDSEQFKRCKIEKSGSYLSYCELRGNAQDVFGRNGFDTWKTDKSGINWSKSGDAPKVKIHNTHDTAHAWTIKVTLETEAKTKYAITVTNSTGGTITANKATTYAGDTVTLTVTPAANYKLGALSVKKTGGSTAVTVTNNKFTMPAYGVTVTATWTQTTFAITKATNPSGAGTVSGSSSALPGASVTVTQSQTTAQANEYLFNGWSISTGSISSGGTFTMPQSEVTVTANYLKRSTAAINKTTLTGGDTAVVTITPGKSTFTHKYKISKSGTSLDTGWVDVAAGVTAVTVNIPAAWSNYVTDAETATGLTLELKTYNGTTQVGSTHTVSGLTYAVPADAVPVVADFTPVIARTVGGTTYANVGDYYVQGHCGVSMEDLTASGAYGATVESLTVTISGYTGSDYTQTFTTLPADYDSGLLTAPGVTRVTVTATDSRGRTGSKYADITVTAYSSPTGTLAVYRADAQGDADDTGDYGRYSLTASFTAVGTNAWDVKKLAVPSLSMEANVSADTGDMLPGTRLTFLTQNQYTVTMTLKDAFETVTISAVLPSAKFILYVDSGGDRLGIMGVANKTIPSGKDSTLEIGSGTQVYIGSDKLEDFVFDNAKSGDGTITKATGVDGTLDNMVCHRVGHTVYASARITGMTPAAASGKFLVIPNYYRPRTAIRVMGYIRLSTGMVPMMFAINTNGDVAINYSSVETIDQLGFAGCWPVI